MNDGPAYQDRDYSGGDEYPTYRSRPYSGSDAPATPYPTGEIRYTTGELRYPTGDSNHPPNEPRYPTGEVRYPTGQIVRAGEEHRVLTQAPEPLSWRHRAMQRRKNMPWWQELPLLLIVAFCLAVLVRTFLVQAFFIPSGSMEDTLQVGDRVVVNKLIYNFRQPSRGDIVVFEGTDSWAPEYTPDNDAGFFTKMGRTLGDLVGISQPGEKDFVKRVVGVPGDTVACCDVQGRVTVNSYPLTEPYVTDDSPRDTDPTRGHCGSRRFEPVTVGPGQLFVMGDHRLVSQDSRCQGQVPIDHVIGQAQMVIWPVSHLTWLSSPATFDKVPKSYGAGPTGSVPMGDVPQLRVPAATSPDGAAALTLMLPLVLLSAKPRRARGWRTSRRRRLRE